MSRKVVFRKVAQTEVDEAIEWFEAQQIGLGERFLEAVLASIEAIEQNPLQYQRVYSDRRRAVVARFHFNLMYFVSEDEVVIVACLHGRRDPRRWKGRV